MLTKRTLRILIALGAMILPLTVSPLAAQPTDPKSQNPARPDAKEPCCSVKATNLRSGVVTARVLKTGSIFQFRVEDAAVLRSIRFGQWVFYDQAAGRVDIYAEQPCCSITAIDTRLGSITVKEVATGETCKYQITDRGALRRLRVGQLADAGVLPQAQELTAAAQGASSGGSPDPGGSSKCGWNGPRGADTRPKDCTDIKTGKAVACPK